MLSEVDWLRALKVECERTSQAATARKLGVSSPMLSQVLSGTYPASTRSIEEKVRAHIIGEFVECPVMERITKKFCLDWQDRAKRGAHVNSALHGQVFKCCLGDCPISAVKEV